MTIPVATIDESGISTPGYDAILAALQADYRAIYGSDVALDADTQDGQFLAGLAAAMNDVNMVIVDAYNSFSPNFAQGVGLSNVVKITGIRRQAATQSTVDVELTGQSGTVVTDGKVQDVNGNLWSLPPVVTIGIGGTVVATATADEEGEIEAAIGEVNQIATPTRGWQSVTNAGAAEPGAPVETDAALRRRQAASVALPSLSVLEGIAAAVGDVEGVSRSRVYENDTDATDGDGIPEHSIAVVVQGGDSTEIAQTILDKKTPGTGTFGDVTVIVYDDRGVPSSINYLNLTEIALKVEVTINDFVGYSSATEDKIKAAVALFVNRLEIGEDSYINRLFAPANLSGSAAADANGLTNDELAALADTFTVTLIRQAKVADAFGTVDISIGFDEAATLDVADVTVIVI